MVKQNGVTLIELLVAIVVIAVSLAMALPAMSQFIKNNRANAHANELVNDIQVARSEAIKRGAGATICVSTNSTSCAVGDDDWGHGWLVFSDLDLDGVLDIDTSDGEVCHEAEDCIRKTAGPISGDGTISGNGTGAISFLPTGLSRTGAARITLTCTDCTKDPVRNICVTSMGHTYIKHGTSCP